MATREEADRTLAFHADTVMANPNVSLISVIQDENGEYVIEIGLVASEFIVDPTSSEAQDFSMVAPDELAIPDLAGRSAQNSTNIPVRKRIVGKIQVRKFNGKQRPALGGNSCGPAAGNWYGTLGARVQHEGKACILSNWHVLYGGAAKDGAPILQQAAGDNGTYPVDTIAYNLIGILTEHLDVALATIREPVDDYVKKGTISYGDIAGTEKAADKMSVKKCGRTTEATTGEVRSTNATVRASGYPDGDRIFKEQLQMTKMSAAGDSGSIILNDKNKAVGLLFADSVSDTFANKIERVVDALGVSF